jgi:archaellum biogenesis ATPase FlaH
LMPPSPRSTTAKDAGSTRCGCGATPITTGTPTPNLLIVSPTGGGKTYLASAIGIAACHNEHTVTYVRTDDLARRLVLARADAIAHQQLLNELSNVDLLILDDFLTVNPALTPLSSLTKLEASFLGRLDS